MNYELHIHGVYIGFSIPWRWENFVIMEDRQGHGRYHFKVACRDSKIRKLHQSVPVTALSFLPLSLRDDPIPVLMLCAEFNAVWILDNQIKDFLSHPDHTAAP
jgi:hypothetical protein